MADPSEVSICNRALARLGEGPITSIEAPTTDVGEQCALIYEDAVRELLVSYPWNFAVTRQALVASGTPVFGFAHAFVLPTDPVCLRALDTNADRTWGGPPVWPPAVSGLWQVERLGEYPVIVSDVVLTALRYIAGVTDPVQFAPHFRRALVAELTAQLAYSITEKAELSEALRKEAQGIALWAKRLDGQEGASGASEICNLALARLGEPAASTVEAAAGSVGERAMLIYPDVLFQLLTAHPWTFAVTRQALVAIAEPPAPPVYGFAYAFTMPTDPPCLRALDTSLDVTWGSTPPWPAPPTGLWRVETLEGDDGPLTVLVADDSAVSLRYIAAVTDPARFSPEFRRALVAELAASLAYAVTDKPAVVQDLRQEAKRVMAWAKSVDASVGRTGSGQARTLIDVRRR